MASSGGSDDPRSRWNDRYLKRDPLVTDPDVAPFLVAIEPHVPRVGCAVDVGAGLGANALWLADRGLDVTIVDVSDVAMASAVEFADSRGQNFELLRRDVEADGLPEGRRWDFVLMHLFFGGGLVLGLPEHLEVGGVLALCQPTVENLERHPRPGARFLLESGQVFDLAEELSGDGSMEIVDASEGWRASGRHDGWLVARKL